MSAPERLSDAEVAELERLEKAATPGPWSNSEFFVDDGHCLGAMAQCMGYADEQDIRNAELIAAARNALPRLLADRRALREALERHATEWERARLAFGVRDSRRADCERMAEEARALLAPRKAEAST